MKIQVLQENLVKSLQRSLRTISPKAQLPILQNVLLKTDSGLLKVVATSLETTVSSLVKAKVEEDGGACVPAKIFAELVSSLSKEALFLEEREGTLSVYNSKTHAELPTVPVTEFPVVSEGEGDKGNVLDKGVLVSALEGVLFSAAIDDSRPVLTGVRIETEKEGQMTLVATDGFRLSLKRSAFPFSGKSVFIVPARALSEVCRILSEEKEEKSAYLNLKEEGKASFSVGDTVLFCRTLDGQFPDFERIIPKQHTTSMVADAQELQSAVKSVSLFARDTANILRLHIEKNRVVISANTPQVGKNTVEVNAEATGDDADIAFNSRFLSEFLVNYKEEKVVFEMTGSLNPGLFHPPGDETYFHIIMPVRVQSE